MSVQACCCGSSSDIPAESSAGNIIVDFRINLVKPNAEVLYKAGDAFELLKNDVSEIQKTLINLVYNTDPSAIKTYKCTTYTVYILFFCVAFLFIGTVLTKMVLLAYIAMIVLLFELVFILAYNFWVRRYCNVWARKILPVLLNYVKKEFRKVYSPNLDIHLLHPIQQFRHGRKNKIVANWVVIRITNGPIQQPVNAPVYWSSNGTVILPEMPIIVQDQLPLEHAEGQIQVFAQSPNELEHSFGDITEHHQLIN